MNMSDLGVALRNRRKSLGFSQLYVASKNNMSRSTISKLESGKLAELGMRKIMSICALLGVELVLKESSRRPTLRDLFAERDIL